ncbi:TetR family transcriptional regulator [Rhodococcus sp. RD6.2]|jgi:AcrR family transcriptional regulator|uniref:TetR/AcrR family transcriptional regulator n=1 Tax=Rhodococcus sp. RD6.2 TaxID=260936 RepID=UPI00063B5B60|nr:TetR/AcrR family transcriptional regulator [Rhodococcus sp. RD6.2]CRK54326.1 TetR family transcriptional regulator [Rhodococcus sp. RD6.2]
MGEPVGPAQDESHIDWRQLEEVQLTPILSASLDAFYELGYHGTTVREVARRVGVTVPALYYHHENKEGLLIALLELSTADVLARAHAADEEGGDDPVRRLANVVEAIVLRMTTRPRLASLEGEVRYLSAENRQRYRAVRKGIEEVVLQIVEAGAESGTFDVDDPAEITRAILGMCQSIPRWYHAEGTLSPQEVAGKYVAIVMKIVGVK